MKPIYFPYTFISSEITEAVAACFDQIIVCQPSGLDMSEQMAESEKRGLLDICVLMKDGEDKIRSIIKDYKQWARVHADGDGIRLAVHGQQKDQIPLFNESSILKIKENIQRKISGTDTIQKVQDSFLPARVFLHMAHEFDMQNQDILQGIRKLDKMENDLMQNLQGEEDVFDKDGMTGETYNTNDLIEFMIPERVEAWSGMMLQASEVNEMTGLFITSSRSVFAYVVENSPGGEIVIDLENIPIGKDSVKEMQDWREFLLKTIQKYAVSPWPVSKVETIGAPFEQGSERRASLSLYIVPGEHPQNFFSRFYSHKRDESNALKNDRITKNTLIGLIEARS
jgi:hypothetical protein